MSSTLVHAGSERLVRLNVFCDVQQEMWLWWAGEWLQTAGKASMTPHADDDEMGTNLHWYSVYFHVQLHIPVIAMISCTLGYSSATEMATAWTTLHC